MENIIEVKNLTKKFGGFTAVDNVSFNVKKGEMFAFLGPNGAGKTTLIKMLTTLMRPTSGEVVIDKKNALKNQNTTRRAFSIVFQDPSLDDKLTAYENMEIHAILYGEKKELRKERIEKLLRFIDLWERKDDLVEHFSGGMKRRLEIARGLVHHPKILFLDEPTLGLDIQTRKHIWDYVKNLSKTEGTTIFFTTHYIEEAEQMANYVTIIDQGKIVASGTADDLKKKTNTGSLGDAFLKLTGDQIREEMASNIEIMRNHTKIHKR
jgi:ABC-2 type transport system ATP-binding protein